MNDFWNRHSDQYLEMAFRADRCETVAHPDGHGKNTGDCGDTIEMFLTLDNAGDKARIQWVSFVTDGCINTRACANTVAELSEHRTIEEAWTITADQVIDFLKTLPEDSHHCAELAVGALYLALADARKKMRESSNHQQFNACERKDD
jgi:nitrogen fixation NifU-like protein